MKRKHYRILTIDDEAGIRLSFKNYLAEFDYEVLEAEDGRSGLEIFAREKPDIVLVDLSMPGISGLDVIAEIHKDSPDTPVIVVSGTGKIHDAINALRLGAWDYLLKPLTDMEILSHAVDRALERVRLLEENRQYQLSLESEVKKRTDELTHALTKLQENELRYRTVADFNYDWEYWQRPDGSIEYISPSCERISGYAPENFMENPALLNEIILPADRHIWDAHLQNHEPGGKSQMIQFRILNATGETRWIEHACRPVTGTDGAFLGFRASNRDITERQEIASELRQAQKMMAVGVLAGGIAHDFNNILTAIFGYVELIRMKLDDNNPRLLNQLNEILTASERAKELVNQILTICRKGEQEKKPLQVSLIVKEALKLVRASLPVTVKIEENIMSHGCVLADPTQIHQVVMNLCTNAYHALSDARGTLAVTLQEITVTGNDNKKISGILATSGSYLQLTISDTGCGMDRKTLERIFDPYFTTKPSGKGTGLGLSTVNGIVKSHDGFIKVKSEPGKGTEFHIYLPLLLPGKEKSLDAASVLRDKPKSEYHGKIMFVDDEEPILCVASTILSTYGYQVITFIDSEKAWHAFAANPEGFDLVITDMTMPSITGAEFAGRIRKVRPNVPIILCSGYSEFMDGEKAAALGIDLFIKKPIKMSALAQSISKLLSSGE